ncbi:MAG: hypothetical protein ACTS85_01660 [Arsenophonus sp. NC-PG7-MAG3]
MFQQLIVSVLSEVCKSDEELLLWPVYAKDIIRRLFNKALGFFLMKAHGILSSAISKLKQR